MNLYQVVFLADDDIDDQDIFIEALHGIDLNIQCFCAFTGEETIKELAGDLLLRPELVFLDLNMPQLNGKEVLAELKRTEALRDIPVIMYSTFFAAPDIREINELGAAHFFLKPTEFSKLMLELEFVLERRW